jgi:valyl-tRNA synthetase
MDSIASRWILHRFNEAALKVNQALEERQFSKAADVAYQYLRNDL